MLVEFDMFAISVLASTMPVRFVRLVRSVDNGIDTCPDVSVV